MPLDADFQRLFDSYYRIVVAWFLRLGVSPEVAQDLAQETFLRVYKGMDGFRGKAHPRTWILKIAKFVWLAQQRKRGAKHRDLEVQAPASAERSTGRESMEWSANERIASSDVLREAIQKLPPRTRQIVRLRFGHALKYREIAVLLGVSVETVKSQLHQAKASLREIFADELDVAGSEPKGDPSARPLSSRDAESRGWLYPVFFGTNRTRRDAGIPDRGFSSKRSASVTHGRCDVWIPATHRFGELGRKWWKRWPKLEFADDHLRLERTTVLAEGPFWMELHLEMSRAPGDQAHGLVYLHGYHTTFEEAALRAAQIGFDLKVSGATAFFSWPSRGTLRGYPADEAAIEASEEAITRFLVDFALHSAAARVHIVAHSMGNRGLLRALQRLAANAEAAAGVHFGQILLAAADVDRDLFLGLAQLYPQFADRATLYASPGDKAVSMSAWLHSGPRAGYFPPITVACGLDRLDTVAVPDFDLDLLGHSYFAEAEALLHDMFELIRHGTHPADRQRILRKENHWVLQQ